MEEGGGRQQIVYHYEFFFFIEFQKRRKVTEVDLCQLSLFNFVEIKRETNQIFRSISKEKK